MNEFHLLELPGSEMTSSTMFSDPNSTSMYSDTSALIYKSSFALPPQSPLSPEHKPLTFKDTIKISILLIVLQCQIKYHQFLRNPFSSLHDTSLYKFTVRNCTRNHIIKVLTWRLPLIKKSISASMIKESFAH